MLTDPASTPALGRSRSRVLDLLRAADEPMSVAEIATATNLHPNTARFHLDGLAASGLARRDTEAGGRPGRPRTVYSAEVAERERGRRSYRLLAEMLTSVVAGAVSVPAQAAIETGAAWGRYLVERPAPSERVDAADALRRMSAVLADAGFAPEPATDAVEPVVALRQCPFREIAEHHRDVVCSLHLGLMRGALDEVHAPLTAATLEAFVEPSLCLAHLAPLVTPPDCATQ